MRHSIFRQISKANELEGQRHNEVAGEFIRVELELADTFCNLALEFSAERRQEHLFNARRALDAAFQALAKVEMNEKELEGIITKIEEVKALLESLEGRGTARPNC
jgi:hypothetical protein